MSTSRTRKNLSAKLQYLRSKLGWTKPRSHRRKVKREIKSTEKALKALDKRENKALVQARKSAERSTMSVWWHYQSNEKPND